MAKHGSSRHMKRMAVSPAVRISRKSHKYMVKTDAGRHRSDEALSLIVLLRDYLGVAVNKREVKTILNAGDVLVDGVARKKESFPVGIMDIVSMPKMKASYRIYVVNGKLVALPVGDEATKVKYCKLVGKHLIKGGKIQLSFHDGRSQVIDGEEDQFSVGDTIKLAIPAQKITGFLKLEKGAKCYVHSGRHSGTVATLTEVLQRPGSASTEIKLKTKEGTELITHKDYVLVVDDSFALNK